MSLLRTLIPDELRHWLAFGSGVGIEIAGPQGAESLHAAAVRVRPGRARVLDTLAVEDLSHQASGVWGTEYSAFVRQYGLRHVAATVVLPRRDVILRHLALPGVSDKDLAAAIEFQMEGLHPYPEDEAVSSWVRIPATASVLIAVTRRGVLDRYTSLFAEAGVKIGCFTCSAAVIYSALRLLGNAPPAAGLLAYETTATGTEVYGESPARPVFSATFDMPADRAAALAAAELRLDPDPEVHNLAERLRADSPLPYAAALASACPFLSLPLNLLPAGQRQFDSRAKWIPSAALGAAVVLLALALSLAPRYETGALSGVFECPDRPADAGSEPFRRARSSDRRGARPHRGAGGNAQPDQGRHGRAGRDDAHPRAAGVAQPVGGYPYPGHPRGRDPAGRAAAADHRCLAALPRFGIHHGAVASQHRGSVPHPRQSGARQMTLQNRDRRALALLAVAGLVWVLAYSFWPADATPSIVAPAGDPVTLAETRLAKLRETAATVPAKEDILKQVSADLAVSEKGMIAAETAPQAQAQLLQIVRRLGAAETPPVDIRGTELNVIRPLGDAYGEASVSVQIDCRIDQLVNLMAAVQSQPELIATHDLRVLSSNAKEKTVSVRLTVSGVVPRRLVPQKPKTGGPGL